MTARPVIGRPAFDMLRLSRRIAAELSAQAIDPAARLSIADRHALVALAIAVDEEASRRAGVAPLTAHALPLLAAELVRIEHVERAVPTHPAPRSAAG